MSDILPPQSNEVIEQPQLFTKVGDGLVISEEASLSEGAFVAGLVGAIRASTQARATETPSQMDRLLQHRRDRLDAERQAYLEGQAKVTTEVATEVTEEVTTPSVATPMVLQGRLLLTNDTNAEQLPTSKKVAFGRYLKKGIHDAAGERNSSIITDSERRTMSPDTIAPIIYRAKENRSMQQGYFVDDVLLNQVEYRMLPRSPKSLAVDTHAKTMGQLDIREDPNALNRADRSITHVFETMQPVLAEHLGKLLSTRADLEKLSKLVSIPGFAHVGPEEMGRLIAVAWREFDNLIHVIAVQQNWNPEQIQVADTALVTSFTEGPQNQRVKCFADELRFTKRYVGSRVRLFQNRLGITENFIAASDDTKTA